MSIELNRDINADKKIIFEAITTKKGYQGWWAAVCDVNCKLNQTSSIRFEKENVTEEMIFKAIEVRENEKLVWICLANNVFPSWVNTTLSFEIKGNGNKNHFIFIQASIDENWEKHADFNDSLAGWNFFFDSLKRYCETGKGNPWISQ